MSFIVSEASFIISEGKPSQAFKFKKAPKYLYDTFFLHCNLINLMLGQMLSIFFNKIFIVLISEDLKTFEIDPTITNKYSNL